MLTLIGTAAALEKLPRTYQSESSIVLLASPAASRLNGRNPYLSFTSSLTLTADVVSRELMAPATTRLLAARGFPDSYTVGLAPFASQTTSSVLLVTVSGSDKQGVERTLQEVTGQARTSLAALQSGVSPYHRIRARTLSMTPQATLSVSQTARPVVMVFGLGLALSFGIPWLVGAQLAARRIRAANLAAATVPYPAGPAGGDRWTAAARGTQDDRALAGNGRRPASRGGKPDA
jgi:hypothetical protein